ncbi:MAG: hypothetical protein F4138_04560 [Acidimicrobiia bacterium]|nr:hypothetical protein [Acidimicrobiia bacterium]MYC58492.1 hypothetical protein [Acidimicrobiia bacterium]MYG94250.1 hypothetical protein [Acidimicrobiia bacterium]MYI30402.1 hypothetical protein [Acidimicrobiia bacterium]
MTNSDSAQTFITRDQIRNKFAELTGGSEKITGQAQTSLLSGGAVLLMILMGLAYWLGRRKGRAGRTVVEVRRV